MTIPTPLRAWPAIALALSLCACAGDPDLPRSYGQPGMFTPREARRADAPMAPQLAQTAPVAEARDAAADVPPQPAYSLPPRPPARAAYAPPTLAGGPAAALTPVRYSAPPYRPELVPGYAAPQPPALQAPELEPPAYSPPPPPPSRFAALPARVEPEPPPTASRYGAWSDDDYRYRIGPGDELALRFLFNPEQNGQVIVGPDGRGVFPLVSSQRVANLTADQANTALTEAYGAIFRKPQVEVLITAYGSSQIYVGGEVREPGVHPIKGQLTTAQAVLTAGGLLSTARTGRIVVLRQRPDGQLLMKEVDLKAYLYKGRGETDFAILPGDLIFVPRSKIAEVDLFVEQYINGVLPFSRSVGYSVNKGNRY